ncbi:glutaminyl-peptide cyclotransferase [Desertivirga brevis]|uniref:glutaminyl-peptide cyclotransferase n=1 Tax=Desertivirga brevis TaxID=2810310 RepID=UPI001A959EE2|nr:glutaminyl-peptide cyclotransferase [Pedobacter sp. SYSU D00873]
MRNIYIAFLCAVILTACSKKENKSVYFLSPEEGSNVSLGKTITLKLDIKEGAFDSIQYFVDTTSAGTKKDTTAASFATGNSTLGTHLITAKVFKGGTAEEITTNIVLLPATAPAKYSYTVVNTFPHDTASFTEGLEYIDGKIFESDGEYGQSSIRTADLKTGKVINKVDLDPKFFGEGLTVIGDKVIQITYREGVGFIYDKNTLQKVGEFPYQAGREGWGLAFDGKQILNTDGTNNIYFLNKDTYQKEKTIEVYDNKGGVNNLNELEFIDGMIYANVWTTNRIVIINPANGAVEGELDMSNLYPEADDINPDAVLNGIAWDAKGRRLFVTGKKWDKLFEIKIKKD